MGVLIEELSELEIRKSIEQKLGTSEFILKDFKVRPASDNPLGFLGDHVRVSATVNTNGETKEILMFAKTIPCKVESHYNYATGTKAFYKEIELYKTLLADINNATCKDRKPKKWLPDFYYARDWEILVVEDLAVDGYYMLPERTVMDLEHMKVAMETMAIMHAGTFIFEEKLNAGKATTVSKKYTRNGKYWTIEELYDNMSYETEASDIKGHPGNTFYEAGFRSQLALIDVLPDYTPQQKKVMKENISEKLRKILQFVKPSDRFKNVLLHGDLWTNNLLFKKDQDGKISSCMILDFQLARYGPPAHDILMCLYLCQTRDFRLKHEKALFDLYYATLSEELKSEGLNVEKLLPLTEFKKSIDYYREYAIVNNIMYYQMVLTPGELSAKFLSSPELFEKNMQVDRSELIIACFQEDEICRSRMTEAVRETAEYYGWV